jgi:predicted RNase H-like nuclease
MKVVGVDAWRHGWVAVALEDGRLADAQVLPHFAAVVARFHDAAAYGVDIPIGVSDEPREADLQARAFIGARGSSVFAAPPRRVLDAPTYAAARQLLPSLSAQSFALVAKMREVAAADDPRIFEVHPEVSFRELRGEPLEWSKRSWNGLIERRRLLTGAGIRLPDMLERAGVAPADDILDAAVAAWSAHRYARDEAVPLPEGHTGRIGAIWR